MYSGYISAYFQFFTEENNFSSNEKSIISLDEKSEEWEFIDTSFEDFYLNIFRKDCDVWDLKTGKSKVLEHENINRNFLSSNLFSFSTGLQRDTKLKEFSYLNVLKLTFNVQESSLNEINNFRSEIQNIIYEYCLEEFPAVKIKFEKEKLFIQELKFQIVLCDNRETSIEDRKYDLIDLALKKEKGTSKLTVTDSSKKIPGAHSKQYIDYILDKSYINYYQEWSGLIVSKCWVTIFDKPENTNNETNFLKNYLAGFSLIYISQIYSLEFLHHLNMWVNENGFSNKIKIYESYLQFIKKVEHSNISTKYLYNYYHKCIGTVFEIEKESSIIGGKIEDIQNLHSQHKSDTTNLLLLIIAVLAIMSSFVEDFRNWLTDYLNSIQVKISQFWIISFIMTIAITTILFIIIRWGRKRNL